jgi:hypothetical protein
MSNDPAQTWLESFVRAQGGVAGTVHRRTAAGDLALAAAVNIPPKVQEIVARVPVGKGMAGLAIERGQAVTSCNIKTDSSGQVRPGARAIDAQAGAALPVRDPDGSVRAVVGVAFTQEKSFTMAELDALEAAASTLPAAP